MYKSLRSTSHTSTSSGDDGVCSDDDGEYYTLHSHKYVGVADTIVSPFTFCPQEQITNVRTMQPSVLWTTFRTMKSGWTAATSVTI